MNAVRAVIVALAFLCWGFVIALAGGQNGGLTTRAGSPLYQAFLLLFMEVPVTKREERVLREKPERNSLERRLRLQFIECMYVLNGQIKREDICHAFSVAEACASRDLRRYHSMNGSSYLRQSTKTWTACENFEPVPGLLHISHAKFIETFNILADLAR